MGEEKGKTEQRASMAAEQVKRTKHGMSSEAAKGMKVEAMETSMTREEVGEEVMRGRRR